MAEMERNEEQEWVGPPTDLAAAILISPAHRRRCASGRWRRRHRALEGFTYQLYSPTGLDLKLAKQALEKP